MSLWGNLDHASGNQKPVFANTSNATSSSTIHGSAANTLTYYGNVMGVSTGEMANTVTPNKPQHAGWVSQKIGTGGLGTVTITSAGRGYNAAGYLTITDASNEPGTGANISYTIANSENTLQEYSTNAYWNVISTLTVNNVGTGYSNVAAITISALGANIDSASFSTTLGGRAGRIQYETLVAMGSISGDDPRDNRHFTGI